MLQTIPVCRAALLAALLLAPAVHADIYKWVDANGKTHYSDNKDGAGAARVGAIKHAAAPTPAVTAAATHTWQRREREFRERKANAFGVPVMAPSGPRRASQSQGADRVDTDQSKCELARDVISGAVRHGNGAPTDANDRQVAQSDIGHFCR
jgi:hypothetical protein